jgi:hypothetical protein
MYTDGSHVMHTPREKQHKLKYLIFRNLTVTPSDRITLLGGTQEGAHFPSYCEQIR